MKFLRYTAALILGLLGLALLAPFVVGGLAFLAAVAIAAD